MVHFSLELIWLSQSLPHVDLVFVHGYGGNPETAWHDESTGKTWIKDEEFVTRLNRPVRIFSFGYNGDVAANLSSSSPVFHASDLLSCLEQALEKSTGRPLIFVAHGFGGIIIKKAVQLCLLTPAYPRTKNALAGVVFFGTPHVDTNSEALLQATRRTLETFGDKNDVAKEEEVREFASAVSCINSAFVNCKPKYLRLLSFWETLPSKAGCSDGNPEVLVVPQACRMSDLMCNSDHMMECNHENLPRFPGIFSARFMDFIQVFSEFIMTAMSERTVSTLPIISIRPLSPTPQRLLVEEEGFGSRKLGPVKKHRRKPRRSEEDKQFYLERKIKTEEETASRKAFLSSLNGWTEVNSGNHLRVALGTCEWFKEGGIYKNWLTDPKCGTIFYLGSPGHGKSHLARAIFTHLKASQLEDIVLSYFCQSGEELPAIWDYFTWQLIKEWPEWYNHIPAQYKDRVESSPRLGIGAFVDIWSSFRKICSPRSIFLIIDGIDQAAEGKFDEFFTSLEQLRRPLVTKLETLPGGVFRNPTKLKVVMTGRLNENTDAASSLTSRCSLPYDHVQSDIALYLEQRFSSIIESLEVSKRDKATQIREHIKGKAGPYWLYATLAADEVDKLFNLNALHQFSEDSLPTALVQWYDEKMLPLLQSVSNSEGPLRTVLTLIASDDRSLALSVKELESILACLHSRNDVSVEGLGTLLQRHCSDFFWLSPPDSLVLSIHASVRKHLSSYLPQEQKNTNMAFACLKYLLQDCFIDPLPLSWDDKPGTTDRLAKIAPFYSWAAQSWTGYLSKLDKLSPPLVQVLHSFLAEDCPQYKTWCRWKTWLFSGLGFDIPDSPENPAMILIREGCLAALKHFFPTSLAPHSGVWVRKLAGAIRGQIPSRFETIPNIAPSWPNLTGFGHTPLMVAALSGNPAIVDYVLQWPVDVNARDKRGRTILLLYLTSERIMSLKEPSDDENVGMIVRTLLRHGVDPAVSDNLGITPLHAVCMHGKLMLAKCLLDHGVAMNITDSWGVTPLERAYSSGNPGVVELLLHYGADAEAWMLGGEPPLARCIYDLNLEMFRLFLQYADVNQYTMAGFAPIHLASDGADGIEFLHLLLARPDLDLNAVSSIHNRFPEKRTNAIGFAINTSNYVALELLLQAGAYLGALPRVSIPPLHDAVIVKNAAMVELLLSYGAPANEFAKSWFPHTALGHAVDLGVEELVSLLLEYGADPTIEEGHGVTALLQTALSRDSPVPGIITKLFDARLPPSVNYVREGDEHCLIEAVVQGNFESVRLLLEHGVDTSLWLSPGEHTTPLHKAAKLGHVEICNILLKHEPKLLDIQFEKGFILESPLFSAAQKKRKEVVRLLLDKGARVDQLSFHYEESPLIGACRSEELDIVRMVLEVDPKMANTPSYNGSTPLIHACQRGNVQMVKLLLEADADVSHRDSYGTTCVSNQLFETEGDKPFKILELLMKHGLDINAVDTASGLTVLGVAISDGHARHVKWLLERGANPLQVQRGPGQQEIWRNALQVATHTTNSPHIMGIIDLLLESRWGLLDHLADKDYHGVTVLPGMPPVRETILMASRIMKALDEVFKESGKNIFTQVMNEPSVNGLSCVDYFAGLTDAKPSAIPGINKLIVSRINELLLGPRTMNEHGFILDDVWILLLMRGGYESEAAALAEMVLTKPQVRWNDDGYYKGFIAAADCNVCKDLIYEPYMFCQHCEAVRCHKCNDEMDPTSLHAHSWITVKLREDLDINAADIQEILERVMNELSLDLSSRVEPKLEVAEDALANGRILNGALPELHTSQEEEGLETGQQVLQLATLHAFNFLAIRRPAWTPFLPLTPATQALILPWEKLWEEEEGYRWRKGLMEHRNMAYEGSPWRRFQELQYLTRGLTRGYSDPQSVKRDMILSDVWRLYDNEDKVVDSDGKDKVTDSDGEDKEVKDLWV